MWSVFFLFSGIIGLWLINDSFGAVSLERALGVTAFVGNGFLYYTPAQAFHIGLWMVMVSIFAMTSINIYMTKIDQ